jgi:hypothetical protein
LFPSDENDALSSRGVQSSFDGCDECWGIWTRQVWRKRMSNGNIISRLGRTWR